MSQRASVCEMTRSNDHDGRIHRKQHSRELIVLLGKAGVAAELTASNTLLIVCSTSAESLAAELAVGLATVAGLGVDAAAAPARAVGAECIRGT